jgi:hypothetical protein
MRLLLKKLSELLLGPGEAGFITIRIDEGALACGLFFQTEEEAMTFHEDVAGLGFQLRKGPFKI